MKYEKGMTYETEDQKLLVCFELTEAFAFLCPVNEKGQLELTNVAVYSTKEGTTPIETIEIRECAVSETAEEII